MQLVYFDRVQFKEMKVNRTYPTIVGWTAELANKKIKEENKIAKPADVVAAIFGQNVQAPVGVEPTVNVPPSSVDRVAAILQAGFHGRRICTMETHSTPTACNWTTSSMVTSLKEYLALGSSALFWMVDELTEEVVNMNWKET
nr:probable beta-glucosidase F [Ipomoea batatas]